MIQLAIINVNCRLSLQVVFNFNNYTSRDDLVAAINNIRYGGHFPNIPDALAVVRSNIFATSNGARQDSSVLRLAVVFVTETMSRYRDSTLTESRAVADMDIGIVTVGVGTFLDRELLLSITSYPSNENMFIAPSVRNVPDLADSIKRIICSGMLCYVNCVVRFLLYLFRAITPQPAQL